MVRLARDEDDAALGRLMREVRGAPCDPRRERARPKVEVWVSATDELAGYLVVQTLAGVAEIQDVGVDRRHRREGHARAMIGHAIREARRRGCSRAQLEVSRANRAAIALYESFAFAVDGARAGYYPGGSDAVLMSVGLDGDVR